MKITLSILIILLFISCKYEQNTSEFNDLISSYYESCPNKDSCVIDLGEVMPFDWNKMYVFSNEHYPEADQDIIRKITHTNYSGKREYLENRSILFVKDSIVEYEVLTPYESAGFVDTKLLYIEFFDKNILDFYEKSDSRFIIKPYKNASGFNLIHLKSSN